MKRYTPSAKPFSQMPVRKNWNLVDEGFWFVQRGDTLLAMEDYAIATRLMSSKTEALFKHGLHYFQSQ